MTRTRTRLVDLDRTQQRVRRLKVAAHSLRRLARWAIEPDFAPTPHAAALDFPVLLGRQTAALERADRDADPRLEAGKRHNLHLAAPWFDGRCVAPDRPLSFWRTLGRIAAERGFVYGLELRGGCLVPALGGGICLLSNTLFALAARLGWRIHERHGHTLEAVPPAPGTLWGLDATVFWPYVDLRIAPVDGPVRLAVSVNDTRLEVAAYGTRPARRHYRLQLRGDRIEGCDPTRQRVGELWRRAHDPETGAPCGPAECIARSRRTLLHSAERRRSCLSCGEVACTARPDIVPLRLLEPGERGLPAEAHL